MDITVTPTSTPNSQQSQRSQQARDTRRSPLRMVLGANAATSSMAGLVAAIAPAAVNDLIGFGGDSSNLVTRLVGIGLVVFAIDVALAATRSTDRTVGRNAQLVSAADIAWVVATAVVIAIGGLSATGNVIAAVMGLGVASFAFLQLRLR